MFRFLFIRSIRNPRQQVSTTRSPSITHLHFLHHSSSSISKSQEKAEEDEPNHSSSSFTVSYLINSCGLSPHSALSASKKFTIKNAENSDSVLRVLESYGFTKTQIPILITKLPQLLSSKPDKTLRLKLEFFSGTGISGAQLTEIISLWPILLVSSLENKLKPNFKLLTSVFDTIQEIALALRRTPWLLRGKPESSLLPNIRLLRGYGVPVPTIAKLATNYPRVLMQRTEKFEVTAKLIKEMGFDPTSASFIHGIHAMIGLSTSKWKRKWAVYKRCGWSEEECVSAFIKQPYCMMLSEEKIERSMDFFVNKMHWKPSFVSSYPLLLGLSLEKRVIPRCLVLNVLASKGLAMLNPTPKLLKISEKEFSAKYVIKYQDRAPEVLQAYAGNLDFVVPQSSMQVS